MTTTDNTLEDLKSGWLYTNHRLNRSIQIITEHNTRGHNFNGVTLDGEQQREVVNLLEDLQDRLSRVLADKKPRGKNKKNE